MTQTLRRTSHTVTPRRSTLWAFVFPWLAVVLCASASAQSVKRGQVLFETHCVTCHALDANRAGPALRGVVGRPAGKAPEFIYSEALESATHIWDKTKLKAWLTNPESVVPGQEMYFHLDAASDREDVVAYLASLPKPSPTQH